MIFPFTEQTPLNRLMWQAIQAGINKAVEDTATGNPATFTTDLAKPLVSLIAPFTPIQAGTGDPSPDNVRAISGFTGINAVRCGVNLWDEDWESGDIDGSGQNIPGTDFRSKNYIPVIPGMTFYLYYELPNGQTPGSNIRAFYYDRNKTYISNTWCGKQAYTVPANAYYMRFYGDSRFGGENDHISINFPSTDTEYHAYTGNSYAVTFPDSQTIYGGSLDLVSGVLTITHTCVTLHKSDYGEETAGSAAIPYRNATGLAVNAPKSGISWAEARKTQIMNCGKIANPYSESSYGNYIGVAFYASNTGTQYRISSPLYDALSDDDGIAYCYELAEYRTVQLDPVTIQTLIGNNTVWTDTNGTNTVVYLKKG